MAQHCTVVMTVFNSPEVSSGPLLSSPAVAILCAAGGVSWAAKRPFHSQGTEWSGGAASLT